jgi:Zn-dependent protease
MVKCDFCGAEIEGLPYKCKYCGGTFCVWHHLPEEHNCPGLHKAVSTYALERAERLERTTPPQLRSAPAAAFYPGEARDLAIGVAAVALAYLYPYSLTGALLALLVALTAYLPHELAHKLAAQRYGYAARYVLSRWGLLLTLLSALPFMPLRFIVPGYVLVSGYAASRRLGGIISAAGPAVNLAVAALSLLAAPASRLAGELVYANAFIAVFNLLPFGPLDGRKIAEWKPALWLLMLLMAIALFITGMIV